MINKIRDWRDSWTLARHIYKNLPPRDGRWHEVSYNINLLPPKKYSRKELKKKLNGLTDRFLIERIRRHGEG